jgi:DNA helicase-2/ATP-dependent DNA helicase PcrA
MPSLNPSQAAAVTHRDGPLLILAGAGSGKTHVLTQRIATILAERAAKPWEVLAVTFTNKAAAELKARLTAQIGADAGMIWASTFHGLGLRILRKYIERLGYKSHFTVLDDTEQKGVVDTIVKAMELDTERYPPKGMLGQISKAKSRNHTPDQVRRLPDYGPAPRERERLAEIYEKYVARLKQLNGVDYDDLLLLPLRLLRQDPEVLHEYQSRFRYVHVDEYQDTNPTQYELIRLLASGHGNLCVVGDVDQSIYSFRHADFRIILRFRDDSPQATIITLEDNYRSTGTILAVANAIIANNEQRYPKTLRATKGAGTPLPVFAATTEVEEAQYVLHQIKDLGLRHDVSLNDIAILYRTNAQSRPMEEALVKAGMSYQLIGGTRFYERREIKDLLAYLRVVYNASDDLSFKRILNVPKRGIGATTVARLEAAAAASGRPLADMLIGAAVPGIAPKTWAKLAEIGGMFARWRLSDEAALPVPELLQMIVTDTGYLTWLFEDSPLDADDRRENIAELHRATSEFVETSEDRSLGAFLQQVALVSDVDGVADTDAVTLMTLHSAKGLEFPVVFLVGLEEGIFPHNRSLDDPEQMEEERRLMYVGVTRAMERLFLTWAQHRTQWGRTQRCVPSRFLKEAPMEHLQGFTLPKPPAEPVRSAPMGRRQGGGDDGWTEPMDTWDDRPQLRVRQHRPDFSLGDRVRHATWGTGVIQQIMGSGERATYVVEFPGLGRKILDPRFAPLTKAEDWD